MNKTSIEWTHRPETGGAAGGFTWNPIRARNKETGKVGTFCTHASPGCLHCYAEAIGKRFGTGLDFNAPNLEKVEFFIDEKILDEPLERKKPATIFVGDMFDLFHEAINPFLIGAVFGMMLKCQQHTFQILTKRASRMRELLKPYGALPEHLWGGVSVEDQPRADQRIPELLGTPFAVRFLSVEPLLEDIWIEPELMGRTSCGRPDWIIVGGESGPGARPFNLAWAESLLEQCRAAGVPFFMKQIGSHPIMAHGNHFKITNSKGGEMWEWPEHLRVREFPAERTVSA